MAEDIATGILEEIASAMAKHGRKGVILAGHYSVAQHLSEISHEGKIEQRCFDLGVRLVREAQTRGLMSRLLLLVNDIGIDIKSRAALKESYVLPSSYKIILDKHSFNPARLEVLFESTMRNKGSVLIRKIERCQPHLIRRVPSTQTGLVRCIEGVVCAGDGEKTVNAFVIEGPGGEDLVLKEDVHPKCCLILGTLFYELTKRSLADCIVNIFNSVYTARLEYGIHVARRVFQNPFPIWNLSVEEQSIHRWGDYGRPDFSATANINSQRV